MNWVQTTAKWLLRQFCFAVFVEIPSVVLLTYYSLSFIKFFHSLSSPEAEITIFSVDLPDCVPHFSTLRTTSIPLMTLPNTTCFPSSHDVFSVQIKKLRTISIRSCVGHRKYSSFRMFKLKV